MRTYIAVFVTSLLLTAPLTVFQGKNDPVGYAPDLTSSEELANNTGTRQDQVSHRGSGRRALTQRFGWQYPRA